ncbi:MAG: hypothetical protein FJW39_00780 [Acidobacteria bacterium]|nr:hypothetical protein [Acidobacteriota bacterium]
MMNRCLMVVVLASGVLGAQERTVKTEVRVETHTFDKAVPALGSVQFMAAGPLAHQPVAGAPYSAEGITDHVKTLADGTRITRRSTARYARDGKGRTREEHMIPGIGPWTSAEGERIVTISDPVAKEVNILNEKSRTARRVKLPGTGSGTSFSRREIRIERHSVSAGTPPAGFSGAWLASGPDVGLRTMGTPKTETLPNQTIEGLVCTGTRTTYTVPAGEVGNDRALVTTVERWESVELKTLVRSTTKDPENGETTYRLSGINRAEPAAALFTVPADYKLDDGPPVMHFMERAK